MVRGLDALTELIGRALAWLLPVMVLITITVVVLRYLFDTGTIALQEAVVYLHGSLFMLGLGYTLKRDGHVRVDVLAQQLGPRARAWVELCGHTLFLLPLCALIAWYSWDYVAASWRVREASPDSGGLPYVYLLKSLLPLSAALLGLQAFVEMAKLVRRLRDGSFTNPPQNQTKRPPNSEPTEPSATP